jgi:hypothetical protein
MELINATKMQAGYTMGVQPDGLELLVVVVKGTFTIPAKPGEEPKPAEEQVPLVETDEFTGEPGVSPVLYEIDFAPRKPRCDVLLNGSAYAPGGKPAERVTVSLRVGAMTKTFDVVGNRTWKAGRLLFSPSAIEPFTKMPISYDRAFGGVDKANPDRPHYYLTNYVGIGYHVDKSPKAMDGKPMPNTEEKGKAISSPSGNYKPMAFGPLGRPWQQRVKFAGTYDKNWLDNVCPFLPADFKDEYYQAAPEDQWISYPSGGEEVELINLTPGGRTVFRLPKVWMPVEFFHRNGERKRLTGVVDTLVVEPDEGRFCISWRCSVPLRRNIREYRRVLAGHKPPSWYREEGLAPDRGVRKTRFRSLAELAAWNRKRASV